MMDLPTNSNPDYEVPHHVEVWWMGQKYGYVWALFDSEKNQIGEAQYNGWWRQPPAIEYAGKFAKENGVSELWVYKQNGELKKKLKV